ncbi:MAG: polysaccharide biosynthesis/export family protein [Syntrophobacteraceae bacterium]
MNSRKNRLDTLRSPILLLFGLLLAIAVATACSSVKTTTKLEDFAAKESESKVEIKRINDQLFAAASNTPQPQDYILGEGDLLQISVYEASDLKTEVRVGARGLISLPLLGAVEVTGSTVREAEQKIEDLYRSKYIQDPHVNVFVKEHVSSKISVLGAVKKPGTFDHLTRQKILDVLAMAEGLTEKAGRVVQLRRPSEDPNDPNIFFVDLDEIVVKGRTELNIEVKRGDSIYVPDAGTVYVDGAVKKPGNYPVTPQMSVREAIAAAGGFSSIAHERSVKLIRLSEQGTKEVVQVNLEDSGKDTKSVEIRDRDAILVEANPLAKIIYGLRWSFLGTSFGYTPPTQ